MKRIIRETYRNNRDRFPAEGKLVLVLLRTDTDNTVGEELLTRMERLQGKLKTGGS